MLSVRRPLPTGASSAQDPQGSRIRRSREGGAGRLGRVRAAAQPGARSGAAASRPQQVGPTGVAGLHGSRCGASELGLLWSVCNHFPRRQPGATGLRLAHFARRGVAGVPRPPLSLERARGGGDRRPGPDKGREGGGGAERGLARKGALSAPALTFEDRAELLQGHVPQRRRSESARGGGGAAVTARHGSSVRSPSPAAAAPLQRAQRLSSPRPVPDGRRLPAR